MVLQGRLSRSIAIPAVLGAALVACSGAPDDTAADDVPGANDTQTVEGADSQGIDAETGDSTDPQASGDLGAGSAWVEVDGERYETRELNCDTDFGGADFAGEAEGPRSNARIHGRFDTSMPDLIAVAFARGDEGEFRALAENELVPHGVLEDYTFDSEALTMSGSAEFGWVNEDGEADLDNLYAGTFKVTC